MQSFNNKEFLQWANDKKLSFLSQTSWAGAENLLPPDDVAVTIPANVTSHANLYTNAKKELFLAIYIVPDHQPLNSLILVFKQLSVLK